MMMKQKYAVVILFCLICASGLTSFGSYRATERVVAEDMTSALTKALAEQQSDFISTDTIRTFNSYLKMEQLRGHAVLAVTTRQEGWGLYCFWHYRKQVPLVAFGGLAYSEAEGRFYDAMGKQVRLTPMQQQLMEMFFHSESHQLSKTEICDALWPKKDDANDTLYTLIRRLKPIIEEHSELKIESDRGRAYELKHR